MAFSTKGLPPSWSGSSFTTTPNSERSRDTQSVLLITAGGRFSDTMGDATPLAAGGLMTSRPV